MKKILISEDAFGDLNDGFVFYEAQDFGLGDYFTAIAKRLSASVMSCDHDFPDFRESHGATRYGITPNAFNGQGTSV